MEKDTLSSSFRFLLKTGQIGASCPLSVLTTWRVLTRNKADVEILLWMDKILHHFKTMGNVGRYLQGNHGFLGGAKWISSIHGRFWLDR